MKNIFNITLLIYLTIESQVFANIETNKWGIAICGAQISLALDNSMKDIKTNEPIKLEIRLKNVSENIMYIVRTDPIADFSFIVALPSGKIVTAIAKISSNNIPIIQRQSSTLKPNETFLFPQVNLHSICDLTEEGVYTVTVKRRMPFPYTQGCEVISNPLFVRVVPGEWKPAVSKLLPTGF